MSTVRPYLLSQSDMDNIFEGAEIFLCIDGTRYLRVLGYLWRMDFRKNEIVFRCADSTPEYDIDNSIREIYNKIRLWKTSKDIDVIECPYERGECVKYSFFLA